MTAEFIKELAGIAGDASIRMEEPMSRHTTFHIGGPAELFMIPGNEGILMDALSYCNGHQIPWTILGHGSNLLVGDGGIRGVVFQIFHTMDEVTFSSACPAGEEEEPALVRAGAGIGLSRLCALAAEQSLSGLEFASGIPGTLGGALSMNAGAYGGEMSQVVRQVTVLTASGQKRTLSKEELAFGYRTSVIQKESMTALSAELVLKPGDGREILERIHELSERRREKQPLEFPSAGSTFKRPDGYFAGKLIEDAGLKGKAVGGAMVSTKHSGFIINTGGATARDVRELILVVQDTVYERFGVRLEPEIRMIGDFI